MWADTTWRHNTSTLVVYLQMKYAGAVGIGYGRPTYAIFLFSWFCGDGSGDDGSFY